VPGLEAETMSFHRIGWRGVRRLRDRRDPLLLDAPAEGALRVRLRPARRGALRGPAWFDAALADRLVGGLYPKYRESGPFSAQLMLQRRARGRVMLRYAYNTNGAANHRLEDAVAIIADADYDGIALTLDIHHVDPMAEGWIARAEALAKDLAARRLGCVIETGARYLLDPRRKHEPTLLTPTPEGRARRVDFLNRAVDIGAILGAEAVSFWAGVPLPGVDRGEAGQWLKAGVAQVLEHAERRGVVAALEPEPACWWRRSTTMPCCRRTCPAYASRSTSATASSRRNASRRPR
jgi:hypothetical protein